MWPFVLLLGCSEPVAEPTSSPLDPSREPSIVFVNADWSVQSVMARRALFEMLADDPRAPPVVIVDADDEPAVDVLRKTGTAIMGGNGETFWVKDGAIVASLYTIRPDDRAVVQENNARLTGVTFFTVLRRIEALALVLLGDA